MPGNHLSQVELDLQKRWDSSNFGPALRSIEIRADGNGLRGLRNLSVDFPYPLTAIAGKNGVGKSTLLACVCCAYQNQTPFRSLISHKAYFNFDDFLVSGWGDTPVRDVTVTWTHRGRGGVVELPKVTKAESRWVGYGKRPSRPVEFVGTLRAVHPCELRLLRNRFGINATNVRATALEPPQCQAVGQIIGRNYDAVHLAQSGKHHLHCLHHGQTRYSGFNSGSGEDITCLIARVVDRVPEGGLLIIEEVETGLHASAQRQLAKYLLQACLDRKIQVICTTHSAEFLAALPTQARVLLLRNGTTPDVRPGVTVAEATRDLLGTAEHELVICVEDDVARRLLHEMLDASVRRRIRVIPCGSWEDVLRQMAAFVRDPGLGKVIGVLDGDRKERDTEHFSRFKSHLGGQLDDEAKEWLRSRLLYCPGTAPPEVWLWQLGVDDPSYRNALAVELRCQPVELDAFFGGPALDNHHDLPYELAQRVGTDTERVLSGLCEVAVRIQGGECEEIIRVVERSLRES